MLVIFFTFAALCGVAVCSPLSAKLPGITIDDGAVVKALDDPTPAPTLSPNDSKLRKTYIVKLKTGVPYQSTIEKFQTLIDKSGDASSIGYLYDPRILSGFSATLVRETYEKVSEAEEIEKIYPDTKMSILPVSVTEDLDHEESMQGETSDGTRKVLERNAAWGLQRIAQRSAVSNQDWTGVNFNYTYRQPAGKGVFVYILDTGVRASHRDFQGRAKLVKQFGGYQLADRNGHGTHCSGLVGGYQWGAAKSVQLRGVKVLGDDGQGYTSDIIAGIDYVADQFRASGYRPTVASLSIGGDRNDALDEAVSNAVKQGIHVAVAAGNSNEDACSSSPAASSAAITVAATTIADNRAYYSNYGPCVDILAPGSNITSSWYTSDRAVATISGTSMSTPYVAGIIAYYLAQHNMTTDKMKGFLRNSATPNAVQMDGESDGYNDDQDLVESTPNLLLYNSIG